MALNLDFDETLHPRLGILSAFSTTLRQYGFLSHFVDDFRVRELKL